MILKLVCIWLILFNIIIDDARNHERETYWRFQEVQKYVNSMLLRASFNVAIYTNTKSLRKEIYLTISKPNIG
jgi:hypothetical protein